MVLAQVWCKGFYKQNDSYSFRISEFPSKSWKESAHHSAICEL